MACLHAELQSVGLNPQVHFQKKLACQSKGGRTWKDFNCFCAHLRAQAVCQQMSACQQMYSHANWFEVGNIPYDATEDA